MIKKARLANCDVLFEILVYVSSVKYIVCVVRPPSSSGRTDQQWLVGLAGQRIEW
jgi:hypothetical protein